MWKGYFYDWQRGNVFHNRVIMLPKNYQRCLDDAYHVTKKPDNGTSAEVNFVQVQDIKRASWMTSGTYHLPYLS